ncbi:unnamed protein product [Bursaphelenchus okinawaensis]|uniref:Uncharacterized protein n=1 Tax=Bursaphelenchus okinawaensis TaxID=465554 RepID=A0A811K2C0_9BILA|nr:unnamed protein product [Bursaphelenchus okinawaensis]CAG9090620.1 unnamed protein product [Bursaphelenchus okinawaensis]
MKIVYAVLCVVIMVFALGVEAQSSKASRPPHHHRHHFTGSPRPHGHGSSHPTRTPFGIMQKIKNFFHV